MGTWNVLTVTGESTPLDNPFGHNFKVKIRIRYMPSRFHDRFVEPPILEWGEIIKFNDYVKRSHWEFEGNMYEHKPGSVTVSVWGQRYFRAYLQAHNMPYDPYRQKGHSKLYDATTHQLVTGTMLGKCSDMRKQNDAVRNFLKRHGGILEIMVHDIPGISLASKKKRNIERILIFNCGVRGMGPRVNAWQHLAIDTEKASTTWTRNFQLNASPPELDATNLEVVWDSAQDPNRLPPHGSAD